MYDICKREAFPGEVIFYGIATVHIGYTSHSETDKLPYGEEEKKKRREEEEKRTNLKLKTALLKI
jgi:hypothetical protein